MRWWNPPRLFAVDLSLRALISPNWKQLGFEVEWLCFVRMYCMFDNVCIFKKQNWNQLPRKNMPRIETQRRKRRVGKYNIVYGGASGKGKVSRNPNIIREAARALQKVGKQKRRSRVCLRFRRIEIKIPNSVYPGYGIIFSRRQSVILFKQKSHFSEFLPLGET